MSIDREMYIHTRNDNFAIKKNEETLYVFIVFDKI